MNSYASCAAGAAFSIAVLAMPVFAYNAPIQRDSLSASPFMTALRMPPMLENPAASDRITFGGGVLPTPE
jgi:hypothetical protein